MQTSINLVNNFLKEVSKTWYDYCDDLSEFPESNVKGFEFGAKIINLPIDEQLELLVTIVEEPNKTKIEQYNEKHGAWGVTKQELNNLIYEMLKNNKEFKPDENQIIRILNGTWRKPQFITMTKKYVLKNGLSSEIKESLKIWLEPSSESTPALEKRINTILLMKE